MEKTRKTLVCLDRDGTINKDENDYLGRTEDWATKIEFLPGVVDGITLANQIRGSYIYIVTNQSGVAQGLFEEFRMDQVNREIIARLREKGCRIGGCFSCPYVPESYAKKCAAKNPPIVLNPKYVRESQDYKPKTGMLEKAARAIGEELKDVNLFVIGDRATDVEMALNGGGTGILVEGFKSRELGDLDKVKEMARQYGSRVQIAPNFLEAAVIVKSMADRNN